MRDQIVAVEDWHVERLAVTMQTADVDAVWALGHLSPFEALDLSVKHSTKVFTWLHEGDVGCIVGYSANNPLAYKACPWLLASPLVHRSPRYFLRASRSFLDSLLAKHELLTNVIDARHTWPLYTSDPADALPRVDSGGRRLHQKKNRRRPTRARR